MIYDVQIVVFMIMTPCSSLGDYQPFRGVGGLRLQSGRYSSGRSDDGTAQRIIA
jgi:hypothetical protein